MTDTSMLTPPGGPASPSHRQARPGPLTPALLAAVLIIAGSVVIGIVGGTIWAGAAPRVVYQVQTLSPPTAYATNPETSAFIAADGWFCFVGLAGGALIGLLGYLFGVRRFGPVPMAGIVVGSVIAAFVAAWAGHQLSGGPGFDHLLATSRTGEFLHAPISLGAHGALAFWPLGAAAVAGGIELIGVLKARREMMYEGTATPGMALFGARPYLGRTKSHAHSADAIVPPVPGTATQQTDGAGPALPAADDVSADTEAAGPAGPDPDQIGPA
jgi:hypothetical protein